MHGFLIIDKPQGLSSQQVVTQVRKSLGVKKAGHTGTLDPLATGVLPIALGEATKIIPFLDESHKVYEVEGRLGIATDTYDAEGKVQAEEDPRGITESDLLNQLKNFLGEQSQIPPQFSAVKWKGRPLYSYARRGEEVPANSRTVTVHQLELRFFNNPRFALKVHCSRGTYIRTLVHDLGKNLGCGAHVTQLRRTRSGPFSLKQALTWEEFLTQPEGAREKILSIEDCLSKLPQLNLDSEYECRRVESGVNLKRLSDLIQKEPWGGKTIALKFSDRVVAVVKGTQDGGMRYERVLKRR